MSYRLGVDVGGTFTNLVLVSPDGVARTCKVLSTTANYAESIINPGTEERELPAKCTLTVRHGDVYRHELAGAGGWGDPFARDPERVLRDVMEEKISPAYARREYGVAIDERTWKVVPEETARLRAGAQTSR